MPNTSKRLTDEQVDDIADAIIAGDVSFEEAVIGMLGGTKRSRRTQRWLAGEENSPARHVEPRRRPRQGRR
jgi:hypothetical protein